MGGSPLSYSHNLFIMGCYFMTASLTFCDTWGRLVRYVRYVRYEIHSKDCERCDGCDMPGHDSMHQLGWMWGNILTQKSETL